MNAAHAFVPKRSSPAGETIPVRAARQIYGELAAALPGQSSDRVLAMLTLQTFELLNAKPPGWLVSVARVGLQAASFFLAAIVVMVLLAVR